MQGTRSRRQDRWSNVGWVLIGVVLFALLLGLWTYLWIVP